MRICFDQFDLAKAPESSQGQESRSTHTFKHSVFLEGCALMFLFCWQRTRPVSLVLSFNPPLQPSLSLGPQKDSKLKCYYTANGLTNYYMLYCFSIWIDFLTLAVEYCPECDQLSILNRVIYLISQSTRKNCFGVSYGELSLDWNWGQPVLALEILTTSSLFKPCSLVKQIGWSTV